MAKLNTTEITYNEIKDYIENYSDFSFELKVKNSIPSDYNVKHGGSYLDPVTGLYREFDFRLFYSKKRPFLTNWKIALEAKNVKPNSPILVTCLPREKSESFHEVITSKNNIGKLVPGYDHAYINKIGNGLSDIYPKGEFVGKSFTQVAKNTNGDFINTDSDIYSKWSQSINSANDLIIDSFKYSEKHKFFDWALGVIIPVCVVPENMLWSVNYNDIGERISEPERTNHVAVYSSAPVYLDELTKYTMSHVHFLTENHLSLFLEKIIYDEGFNFVPAGKMKVS